MALAIVTSLLACFPSIEEINRDVSAGRVTGVAIGYVLGFGSLLCSPAGSSGLMAMLQAGLLLGIIGLVINCCRNPDEEFPSRCSKVAAAAPLAVVLAVDLICRVSMLVILFTCGSARCCHWVCLTWHEMQC